MGHKESTNVFGAHRAGKNILINAKRTTDLFLRVKGDFKYDEMPLAEHSPILLHRANARNISPVKLSRVRTNGGSRITAASL